MTKYEAMGMGPWDEAWGEAYDEAWGYGSMTKRGTIGQRGLGRFPGDFLQCITMLGDGRPFQL